MPEHISYKEAQDIIKKGRPGNVLYSFKRQKYIKEVDTTGPKPKKARQTEQEPSGMYTDSILTFSLCILNKYQYLQYTVPCTPT